MPHQARRDQRGRLKGGGIFPLTRSEGTRPVPRRWYGLTLLLLTAVYFGTGRLGLSLEAFSQFATLVWLPSGIAVAFLFLWGYRLWPAITLGAFLVNFFTGAHVFAAIGISLGNTLEALVCTALLKREQVQPALDSLHDVLILVLVAAPLSALISATMGVSSLWLGGNLGWSSVPACWSAWWLGDVSSVFVLTPFLLTWSRWPHLPRFSKRLIELGLLCTCVLLIGLFLFLRLSHLTEKTAPTTYLVFPPLIWAALRFGPRGATMALIAFSSFALVGTILDVSPFAIGSLGERLFFLQGFMAITAATTFILAAMTAERRALEQRKDAFLSMVSHELRTPLTSLQGYTQLLQKQFAGSDSPRALHALAIIETQIRRLTRLIEDLLDLSTIQAGKLTFTEGVVDMDALVREAAEQFQQTTSRHHITIEGGPLGACVGDHERLGQVLSNLLTNAIKYSPESERIILHLTSTASDLTVSVQDFGMGIPSKEQKKVFERFYRVAGKHTQTTAGLGIGLSITQQIIEHYEGKLWVESVEGQGSIFSFSLPR